MNWTTFVKRGALGAALILALSAAKCDKQGVDAKYAVERVPDEYRQCFAGMGINVRDYETGGKILWKDAQRLIVDLKADNNALRRCGRSTIAWVDAQHAALNRYLGR
jgi:hypothetical protein